MRVLNPREAPPAGADPNPFSMVMLAHAGGFDALLTADAESDALSRLTLPRVDLLKVSHHGSSDAGLPEVLGRLWPSAAVISAGAGNSYGHPTPETLQMLAAHGVPTYRTDVSGDVVVSEAAAGLVVGTEG
jgi:competence protein ComEC